ncbi:E3 ubiquitin-protein ligase rnf8-like isoform X2 [Hyalella azteca]|uniref:E3 ubiquitin-protein ligase CHFR n=1 Tax=Hyalella azteca TaxID=294128 RepID=A0A979FMA3_HYAAZ|nr:E3 ubiquitin-protein ligase rnf8-like isoform X2 [Hyalella azteca]
MELNAIINKPYYYLKRISLSEDKKYFIIPFKGEEVSVGRSLESSFVLPDVSISRQHAVFKKVNSHPAAWTVKNVSSSGTLLNGVILPQGVDKPLHLNDTVQFGVGENKFLYKFAVKIISSNRAASTAASATRAATETCNPNLATNKAAEVSASHSLVEAHDHLELRLHDSRTAYDRLLKEKEELAQSLQQQKLQLEKKYQDERDELQRQVMEDKKKQELQETQEKLSLQLQQKVEQLEQRLANERAELEAQMRIEQQKKEELQSQQEMVCNKLLEEKRALQEALEQERVRLQAQMQEQVTEKVQLVEQQLQEQLKQVQSRLQQQEDVASSLSRELEKKAEAEQRLQTLEEEKTKLEQELEKAKQDGQQISTLQSALEQMDQDKATLQQEMEMMEFAVSAEAKKAVLDTVEQAMDSEMQCPICNELFIKAILLNCSHTFCEYCINSWKKNKRDCPACRAAITSETRSLAIDNFIDKIVNSLSEDMKINRLKTIKDREDEIVKAAAAEAAAKAAKEAARSARGRGRRGRGRQRRAAPQSSARGRGLPGALTRSNAAAVDVMEVVPEAGPSVINISTDDSDDSHPGDIYMGDLSSSSESGDEDAYYGGYGHCYSCGRRGHWANGCPYR